jgi:phosphatidylglycerophosphatase A
MKKKTSYFLAAWFGAGYLPISGTAASLVALPLAFAAAHFGGVVALASLAFVFYILGTFAVREVLKDTEHDPSIVVIDEVVGQLITLLPFANSSFDWRVYAIGFALFRLFDITKPFPANYFDGRVLNAHGVMLDDVVAGIYAAASLFACQSFL